MNISKLAQELRGFNPLNQVYVFNNMKVVVKVNVNFLSSFNPLNQVYVFN